MSRLLSLITWVSMLTVFGCGQVTNGIPDAAAGTRVKEQYVSITCPAGDITLTLDHDQAFELSISFRDENTGTHNGQETVSGKWIKYNKELMLVTSDGNEVHYNETRTAMGIGDAKADVMTYGFKSSQRDFFATGFDLLERGAADDLLLNAMKPQ